MIDRTSGHDDRGVTELVGFVIIFGIIISSVGILYMTGFSAMGDVQDHEQTRNAERAMDALGENLNDVVRSEGVTYRAGELSLRSGTISSNSTGTWVNVSVDGQNNPVATANGTFSYESGETTLYYEGGAITRDTAAGGWPISDPPIRCRSDTAIVSLVDLQVDESSVTADGTRRITATQTGTSVETFDDETVELEINSPREGAWQRSLTNAGWTDEGSGQFSCDPSDSAGDEVIVRTTAVQIDYS
ncbi:DUF7289 family protein [Halovivax cerinus]|uniref:Flagellin n=1 Tax=Halovivax cerinus TaxID=1487865 RepID=A0ABD5NKF1_9EURY|nr:hypothetical protein [Halovivax cerinus]